MTSELEGKRRKTGKSGNQRAKAQRFNDAKFIQHELDKAQMQACKKWEVSEADCLEAVLRLADNGYVVTLKYDDYSEAYSCFVRQSKDDGPNFGYILAGRGSSPYKALKQALFKHYTVMAEDWEEFAGFDRRAEIDD